MNDRTTWDAEYDPYKAASGERSSLIFDDSYRTPEKGYGMKANSGVPFLQWFSLISIVGGFLFGCAITVANHFVFAYFNGKRSDEFPQFWVTVLKNIIPKVVHVSWAASLSCSVAQAVRSSSFLIVSFDAECFVISKIWFVTARQSFTLSRLDDIFSSHQPFSIVSLVLRGRSFLLVPLISVQLSIIGLSVLSVLVPGTLTIDNAPITSILSQVPYLNMSAIYPPDAARLSLTWDYAGASYTFRKIATQAATSDTPSVWSAPPGCSGACSYAFTYDAPALKCTDLDASQIWDGRDNITAEQDIQATLLAVYAVSESQGVYNATSSLLPLPVDIIHSELGWQNLPAYNLTIATVTNFSGYDFLEWETTTGGKIQQVPNVVGSTCAFYAATYNASTTFENNTQTSSTRILSYNYPLSTGNCSSGLGMNGDLCSLRLNDTSQANDPHPAFPAYASTAISSRAMAEAFVQVLIGNLSYDNYQGALVDGTSGSASTPLWTPLFTYNASLASQWTFNLTTPSGNLSEGLTSLFSNVTLGFVAASPLITYPSELAYTSANVTVIPTYTQFKYTPWKLWLIYGVAMIFVVAGAAFGLWCMAVNGGAAATGFLSILEATRHRDLDAALEQVDEVKVKCQTASDLNNHEEQDTSRRKIFTIARS